MNNFSVSEKKRKFLEAFYVYNNAVVEMDADTKMFHNTINELRDELKKSEDLVSSYASSFSDLLERYEKSVDDFANASQDIYELNEKLKKSEDLISLYNNKFDSLKHDLENNKEVGFVKIL